MSTVQIYLSYHLCPSKYAPWCKNEIKKYEGLNRSCHYVGTLWRMQDFYARNSIMCLIERSRADFGCDLDWEDMSEETWSRFHQCAMRGWRGSFALLQRQAWSLVEGHTTIWLCLFVIAAFGALITSLPQIQLLAQQRCVKKVLNEAWCLDACPRSHSVVFFSKTGLALSWVFNYACLCWMVVVH